jgi:hypothetical protein
VCERTGCTSDLVRPTEPHVLVGQCGKGRYSRGELQNAKLQMPGNITTATAAQA